MRFSRQGYWSGLPFPSPGDLPNPGIEPVSPALQADSLPTEQQGKPNNWLVPPNNSRELKNSGQCLTLHKEEKILSSNFCLFYSLGASVLWISQMSMMEGSDQQLWEFYKIERCGLSLLESICHPIYFSNNLCFYFFIFSLLYGFF